MIINYITIALLSAGLLFFLGTVVGVIRFPDFFSRIHAASKGDSLSSLCFLTGFAVYHLHDFSWEGGLIGVKLLIIVAFTFLTSPTAAHALTEAAFTSGARPWMKAKQEKKQDDPAV